MASQLVIRPSGVWNSRAPFNDYLIRRRQVLRTYNALTLAIYRLRDEATNPAVARRSAAKWLRVSRAGVQAGVSWREYRRTLPRDDPDPDNLPTVTVKEFVPHLDDALYDLRQYATVSQSAIFETYAQCWALNVLLAKLETGGGWQRYERRLAYAFSPERGSDDIPAVPRIIQSLHALEEGLTAIPAITKTSKSEDEALAVRSDEPTALHAVKFWRAVRNVIVHRGGITSAAFLARYNSFYEVLRGHYQYMEPLSIGGGFKFYDDIVRAMAAIHYKAALWMNDFLQELSHERRGHPNAPQPKASDIFYGSPPQSPPLLLEGDHEASYRWVTDPAFRMTARSAL